MQTKTGNPIQLFELKYEDLTTSSEYWSRKLCNYIRVPCDLEMLVVDIDLKNKGSKSAGIRPPTLDILLRALTSSEISQVESLCEPGMERFGYNTVLAIPRVNNCIPEYNGVQEYYLSIKEKLKLVWLTLEQKGGVGSLIRRLRLFYIRSLIMRGWR